MTEHAKIAKQAKAIMDNFMHALDAAGKQEPDFEVRRGQNIRGAAAALPLNEDFSERMLRNAPAVKDGCVVAEKKRW